MTTADVCKTLGLEGDGTGQCVGVRSHEVLLDAGLSRIAKNVTIIALTPPEAEIAVEGEMLVEGRIHTMIKTITVDIDQLVPLEVKQSNERADPLTLGYEPHMPRAPDFDYVEHTYAHMLSALQSTTAMLASAFAAGLKEMLDVVYIPEGGPEKGQGTVQCRAKTPIARGSMRLYPYGGSSCR